MFHFSANLKPFNVFRGRGNRRFDSYLLSIDFFEEHEDLARLVVDQNRILCADNGNVDLILDFIGQHATQTKPLQELRKDEEKALGHKARPGELSTSLTNRFRQVANDISTSAKDFISHEHIVSVVQAQENMKPTYIVGMEDFTLVTLTALNVEREFANLPLEWYRPASQAAVDFAVKTKRGDFGPSTSQIFGGIHATDFDTAHQAGRLAGAAELDGIASGLVGALKDRTFVDFCIANGEIIELGKNVARPYLRTLQIIAGLHAGYASITGRRPAFHALGVGSPILLPLVALLGDVETYLAVDSTAPLKDAIAKTIALYVDTPAPRKLKAFRIAEFWLAENNGWRCQCPYCRKFTKRHPPDLPKAQVWWQRENQRKLKAEDMHAPSPLAEFLPILSTPQDSRTRKLARMTRIAHNHWIMKRLESALRKHGNNLKGLHDYVDGIMAVYLSLPGSSPGWQGAAEIAWQIARQTSLELPDFGPS